MLRLPRAVVSDEQVPACMQLGIDELVLGDSAVRDVRLGQTCPVLKALESISSRRYQDYRDSLSGPPGGERRALRRRRT